MTLLQKRIFEGHVCRECSLTWIENMLYVKDMFGDEVDEPEHRDWRIHPCYTVEDKVNIRKYLIDMGKLDGTTLRTLHQPS